MKVVAELVYGQLEGLLFVSCFANVCPASMLLPSPLPCLSKSIKLAVKFHAPLVQHAQKFVSTLRALDTMYASSHHQGQDQGTATHPLDPL